MARTKISWNQHWYELDLDNGIDISIGLDFTNSVRAFGVGLPTRKPLQIEGFVGSVSMGGSCNCDEITFVPHCHMTHTETVAHILSDVNVQSSFSLLYLAQLITVNSQHQAVTVDMLRQAQIQSGAEALIIRTLPNDVSKEHRQYADQAAYMCPEAMAWLVEHGIKHLLIDTPSVDPVSDGGALAAHRAFWKDEMDIHNTAKKQKAIRTITELIFAPNTVKDGVYALQLNVGHYALDAMPSRPTLFTIDPEKEM